MAETRYDVLFNLITKAVGTEQFDKITKTMTATGDATQRVQASFSTMENGMKKTTTAVAEFNEKGPAVTRITETQALAFDKASLATEVMANKNAILTEIMSRTGLELDAVGMGLRRMGYNFDKTGKLVDIMGRSFQMTTKNLRKLKSVSKGFRMELLSIMFGMMMVQRAMGGFLRSAMISYEKAAGEQNAFNKATNHLRAAWEFFKFSLIDALAQSVLFKALVGWVFTIINAINRWLALHPYAKEWIILGIAFLFITATILGTLAAVGLLIGGLAKLGFSAIIAIGAVIIILIGIGLVIWGIMGIIKNWGKDWGEVMKYIGILLLGLAVIIIGIAILIGSWPLAMVAAIVAIVALIAFGVSWIIKHWDTIKIYFLKFTGWVTKLFVSLWGGVKIIFWNFIKFVWNWEMTLLEGMAWLWVKLHQGFILVSYGIQKAFQILIKWIINKVAGVAEKLIKLIDWIPGVSQVVAGLKKGISALKSGVDAWGDSLETAKNEQLKAAEAPLEAVRALKDAGNKALDDKIAQINAETEARLKAIDDVVNAEIAAIEKARAEKEAATKAALAEEEAKKKAQAETVTAPGGVGMEGLIGGGLGGLLPAGVTGAVAGAGGNVINKITNIENMTIDVKAERIDDDEIKRISKEGLTEELNRTLGSTNI